MTMTAKERVSYETLLLSAVVLDVEMRAVDAEVFVSQSVPAVMSRLGQI